MAGKMVRGRPRKNNKNKEVKILTKPPAQGFYLKNISTTNKVSEESENVNLVNINTNINTEMDYQSQSSTSNPRVINGQNNILVNCYANVNNVDPPQSSMPVIQYVISLANSNNPPYTNFISQSFKDLYFAENNDVSLDED